MTNKKYLNTKRRIDFILSVIIFLVALPVMLLIAIGLTIIMQSFPLIIQKRGLTEANQVFNIFKFRTIKTNPSQQTNRGNIFFKPDLSQYVPAFCKWLRKTGLDELPQIFNVLKGEMSLVGPRPLTIRDLEILKHKHPKYYSARNLVTTKPGITGMWQVFGNRNEGIQNLLDHDLYYNEHASLWVDLRILLGTVSLISSGKHTDAVFPSVNDGKEFKTLSNTQTLTNY
ncbi:MAG: sugar transferase [Ignavibacteria bacterium]|nr:sugar transferase [Ignavibacteria bacterium]